MKFGRKKKEDDKTEATPTPEPEAKPRAKPPRKQLRLPQVGWVGPVVGLSVSILVGLAIAIFGGKGEIELRPFGPTLPALVGIGCSAGGTIAYGIAGIIACVVLWAVVFLR